MKIITENREAKHNYFLDDFTEAGIVLVGSEVKSLREGRCNLKDSYVVIRGGEAFLLNANWQFNHYFLPTQIPVGIFSFLRKEHQSYWI